MGKIINIGINGTTKRSVVRSTQLINSLILIASVIAFFYCPLLLWLEAYWMAFQLSGIIVFILLLFFVPTKLKNIIVIPIIAIIIIYHMTVVSIVVQNSQLELYIILVSLIHFSTVKNLKVAAGVIVYGIVCYLTSIFLQESLTTIITMTPLQKIVMVSLNSLGLFIGGVYLIIQVKNTNNKYRTDLLKERRRVEDKNKKIEHQVRIIAETNKEITDSINYSKRIQNAILPSDNKVKSMLPDSFILYKPKDIVAG